MTIDSINAVGSTPAAQSMAVGNPQTREVSAAEAADFQKAAEAGPAVIDYSSITMEQFMEQFNQGILLNGISQAANDREELRKAMEEQN
jgi:hypothetical protein